MARPKRDSGEIDVRSKLQSSALKFMQSKAIGSISVRELLEVVRCNRSTFYYHYRDMYELADEAIDAILPIEVVRVVFSMFFGNEAGFISDKSTMVYFSALESNKDKLDSISLLLNGPNASLVQEKIRVWIYQEFKESFSIEGKEDPLGEQLVLEVGISCILGILAYRAKVGLDVPLEMFAHRLFPELPQALSMCLRKD